MSVRISPISTRPEPQTTRQPTRTALYDIHTGLGAKMVDFAGFSMPVQYTGIIEEHLTVRSSVGMFDVSHMGEVEIWGQDALAYVQRITTNDVSKLVDGKIQYSVMCYDDGGIVDDLLVYHMGDHYMLVVNAANIARDIEWMERHVSGDVKIRNRSQEISLLAVQGRFALATLQKLTTADLSKIPYYSFVRNTLAGVDMIISRTGYTGEKGFELYFPADQESGKKVWDAIMIAGKEFGIAPAGLGARDTLRLEMGFCLYGNDIDSTTNPLEAGLGWLTRLEKGEFVGREALVAAKQRGLERKLVGMHLEGKMIARQGYSIHAGDTVGRVTSGTFSPVLGHGIALGYLPAAFAKPGSLCEVMIRNTPVSARVVSLPFVQNKSLQD